MASHLHWRLTPGEKGRGRAQSPTHAAGRTDSEKAPHLVTGQNGERRGGTGEGEREGPVRGEKHNKGRALPQKPRVKEFAGRSLCG